MFSVAPTTPIARTGSPSSAIAPSPARTAALSGHVALHVLHVERRLDRDAARVEGDGLADQPERGVAVRVGRVVAEDDRARLLRTSLRDGEEGAHAELGHALAAERLGLQPAAGLGGDPLRVFCQPAGVRSLGGSFARSRARFAQRDDDGALGSPEPRRLRRRRQGCEPCPSAPRSSEAPGRTRPGSARRRPREPAPSPTAAGSRPASTRSSHRSAARAWRSRRPRSGRRRRRFSSPRPPTATRPLASAGRWRSTAARLGLEAVRVEERPDAPAEITRRLGSVANRERNNLGLDGKGSRGPIPKPP